MTASTEVGVRLTAAQRAIVEADDGPVVVIAGAGTGKTRVIVERVRWLLLAKGGATETPNGLVVAEPREVGRHENPFDGPLLPEQVLVLTYNVKAAAELTQRMYVRSGALPIRALARELAVALAGPRAVPAVAPGFSTVLAAETDIEAEEALDDLGLARITVEETVEARGAVAEDFGGVPSPEDIVDAGGGHDSDAEGAEEPIEAASDLGTTQTPGPAGRQDATPGAGAGEPPPGKQRQSNRGERPAKSKDHPGGRTRPYAAVDPVLRTYLPSPTAEGWELTEEEKARRSDTDRAGVNLVLDYERRAGRIPVEMPHGNPGYDIESASPDGTVRIIEVKSTSGPWQTSQAALSQVQHRVALERGEQYWLYVVERAGDEAAELHAIQNPIGRATNFGFDPGWREVAFDAEAPYEELEDETPDGEREA